MKKYSLLKIILAVFMVIMAACVFSACKPDYEVKEIPGINKNAVMKIERNRLNFMRGMEINTKDIIAKSGCKLADENNEVDVAEYLDSGEVTYEEFDVNTVGRNKKIKIQYNDIVNYIVYDVTDFTVRLFLDEEQSNLWRTVTPNAALDDELNLSVWIDFHSFNYSQNSAVILSDREKALSFNGWYDAGENSVTGAHALSLSPSGGTRMENFHAHFISKEELNDMNISYINGNRVFAGYTGKQIETLNIPEGVTEVDFPALFTNSGSALKFSKLRIPSTAQIRGIPINTGIDTKGLDEVIVDDGNRTFSSYNGALYSKNFKTLYFMPADCVRTDFHSALNEFATYSCAYWQITSIVLPDSVTTLSEFCFAYSKLKSVGGLANNNLDIKTYAFYKTDMKTKEHVENNKLIALYTILSGEGDNETYGLNLIVDKNITEYTVIPNTVAIDGGVFMDCEQLKTVNLGNKIDRIGSSAFSGCTALESIELPATLKYLGSAVFFNCSALKSVTGLTDVTAVEESGSYAHLLPSRLFEGCSSLTTVTYARGAEVNDTNKNALPEGLTGILTQAFYKCTKLPACVLPSTLTRIYNSVFRDCSALKKIDLPASLKALGSQAFYASGLTSIDLTTCPELEELNTYAFYQTKLVSLTIPERFKVIPNYCFYGISTLINVNMGNVEEINQYAFASCKSLKDITWSEKLTQIGNYAFRACSSLESVDWHEGITTLGSGVFHSCTKLKEVTFPDSVTATGYVTFAGCTKLTKITLGVGMKNFGTYADFLADGVTFGSVSPAFYLNTTVKEINVKEGNQNFRSIQGVLYGNTIGNKDFGENGVLYWVPPAYTRSDVEQTLFNLPTSVRVIAPYAFYGQTNIETVNLNEGLLNIGKAAFYAAESIKNLSISSTVTNIGAGILLNSSISNVKIENNPNFATDGNIVYSGKDIVMYLGTSPIVRIADGVTKISDGMFMDNKIVTEVIIPDSVTEIGRRAFKNCENLTKITIGSGLKTLGEEAFVKLPKLQEIVISNQNTVFKANNNVIYSKDGTVVYYVAAMNGMTDLSSIESGVTLIGPWAFAYHATLKEVIMPQNITEIGKNAFYECRALEKFYGNVGLKIGESAFTFETAAKDEESGAYLFCDTLKTVLLYAGTQIGDNAFTGQYGIEKLYFNMTTNELDAFNANKWVNSQYLTKGAPNHEAYFNNDGKGVERLVYSEAEPTIFFNDYSWFYFDENGQPQAWERK